MLEEKRCCGFDPYPARATFLGVFTLAFPALLLLSAAALVLKPFSFSGVDLPRRAAAALLKLINNSFLPAVRKAAAGRLFRLSPVAAGVVFKYLNPLVLALGWGGVVLAVRSAL